jgi:Leucine-rich repeat (LRR) protein
MFRPLDNLKTLILQSTKLKELPRDVFPHLRSLEKLILEDNHIRTWEVDVFDNMILRNIEPGANNTLSVKSIYSNFGVFLKMFISSNVSALK